MILRAKFPDSMYDSYFSVFRELRIVLKQSKMLLLKNACTTACMHLENDPRKNTQLWFTQTDVSLITLFI